MVEPMNPSPRWGLARRILFRFAFSYLVLYNLPFPLDLLSVLPHGEEITKPYTELWNFVVPAVGDQGFGVEVATRRTGSGDTTFRYIQVVCYLVLALVATAIWTFLDRRRPHYARLQEWLRVYVRFALAITLLSYGASKAIPTQFTSPSLDRLLQPFGEASPMGLMWTFMGASAAYTIFAGLAEMLGGLLLLARRTTLLGALVLIGVLANVVMMNLCYDVPVKLYSAHLLAMAAFLALPHLRRLVNVLVLNRPAEPAPIQPLFRQPWAHRGAFVLRTVIICGFTGLFLQQSYETSKKFGHLAPKMPLHGIWEVETLVLDGTKRPPLLTDATRWRRLLFEYPEYLLVQRVDDSWEDYTLTLKDRQMILRKYRDLQWKSSLAWRQVEPGLLALDGTFDGHVVQARLRRFDESNLPLVSRGFHWINEAPYNR
jgi:uncharacterized membrane protein YphA (DoxX/SURF4 family)